jgi:murein DD-endopeptidase MepM/ murein hydrolase activator NlpD
VNFRLLTALTLSAAAVAIPAAIRTDRTDAARSLSQVESKAAAARAKEQVLTGEISKYNDRIRAVETRLAPIQARLTSLQAQLDGLRTERKQLTAKIEAEERRLAILAKRLEHQRDELADRLSAAYRKGDPTVLQILLQSGSVTAAMTAQEGMQRAMGHDRVLITATRTNAATARATRDSIKAARKAVWENEKKVSAAEAEVAVVFNKVNGERVNLDRKELEEEAKDLRVRSARLASRIRQSSGSLPSSVPVGGNGRFSWPVHGPVVSGFGWRWGRMHEGVDIAVGTGVPIGSSGPGTVIVAGWVGGYGNMVVVAHGGGLSTAYAHMSRISVSTGQQVSTGTVLGAVGCTGHCFGPHVHFEVRVNGAAVDPIPYL